MLLLFDSFTQSKPFCYVITWTSIAFFCDDCCVRFIDEFAFFASIVACLHRAILLFSIWSSNTNTAPECHVVAFNPSLISSFANLLQHLILLSQFLVSCFGCHEVRADEYIFWLRRFFCISFGGLENRKENSTGGGG